MVDKNPQSFATVQNVHGPFSSTIKYNSNRNSIEKNCCMYSTFWIILFLLYIIQNWCHCEFEIGSSFLVFIIKSN